MTTLRFAWLGSEYELRLKNLNEERLNHVIREIIGKKEAKLSHLIQNLHFYLEDNCD